MVSQKSSRNYIFLSTMTVELTCINIWKNAFIFFPGNHGILTGRLATKFTIYNAYKADYGVATIRRLLEMIGLFCKRALQNRRYSAKETYNFKEPTNRSHPILRIYERKPSFSCATIGFTLPPFVIFLFVTKLTIYN